MKRILSLVLALAFMSTIIFLPTAANAETYGTYGDLEYTNYGDHIEITDCNQEAISVNIPAEIDGLPVTSIGEGAFYDCTGLTDITIPNSVTSIGDYAFDWCYSLTNITIPDSVTSIGDYAFENCYSLTEITIPNSVTSIGESAFENCYNLTDITIPDSVTSIGDSTFYWCYGLTDITIPDSVTSIGWYAFSGCYRLTNITIPDSVTFIWGGAFSDCTGLTDVYYGGSKDQWNQINIVYDNECLTNANIHFNSVGPGEATPTPAPTPTQEPTPTPTPTGDPNAPSVEIAEVSDYSVEVKVNNCDDTDAQVILAVYNKKGALIEMQNDHNSGEITFLSENLQNVDIKVMLWSGMDGIKPLAAEPAELNL